MGTSWKGELRINIPDTKNTLNIKGSLHPVSKSMSRVKRVNTRSVCPNCANEVEEPKDVPTLSQKIYCSECGEEYSWWPSIKGVQEDDEIIAVLTKDELKEISQERSVFMDLLFVTTMEQIENSHRIGHEGKRYVFAPRGKKDKLAESTQFYQYIAEQIGDRYGVCKLKASATKETLIAFTSQYVEELGRYILVFYQLAFNEDMNELPKYLKKAEWKELDEEEREYSEKLISMLTEMNPDWEEIVPEIAEEMRELVREKQETGKIEVEIPKPEVEEEKAKEKGKEKLKALVS